MKSSLTDQFELNNDTFFFQFFCELVRRAACHFILGKKRCTRVQEGPNPSKKVYMSPRNTPRPHATSEQACHEQRENDQTPGAYAPWINKAVFRKVLRIRVFGGTTRWRRLGQRFSSTG